MCFGYVKAHGEKINDLYTLGFSRVGCAPCINAGKEDIRAWADRSPDMIDKVRDWEKRVGKTFFPPMLPPPASYYRELKDWRDEWLDEDNKVKPDAPQKPNRPINWVDEVVEWAKTVHGGKQ